MKTRPKSLYDIVLWIVRNTSLSPDEATVKVEQLNRVTGASFTHEGVTVTFTGKGYTGEK